MQVSSAVILMIEDDPGVLKLNQRALERMGYAVRTAQSLEQARALLHPKVADLFLLDVVLPDGSGMDFIREIRAVTDAPILMLTSRSANADVIGGLMSGADEYMTKPYRINELQARIVALLRMATRRANASMARGVTLGPLSLDLLAQRAFLHGQDMLLSPKEYQMLFLLARQPNQPITKQQLYQDIWQLPAPMDDRMLRNTIYRLRKKLDSGTSSLFILSERGEGYFLVCRHPATDAL